MFRLCYYIIPLFLAGTLFAGNELLLRGTGVLRRAGALPGAQAIGRWSEPDFVVAACTGIVALCGALLLSLGVLAPETDFSWIDPDFADVVNRAGQFVPSLIGAALMVLALGLAQRVNLAWTATIVLLLLGATFTLAEAEYFWIPGVLVLAALSLAPFHRAFYRNAQPALRQAAPVDGGCRCSPWSPACSRLATLEPHLRWLARNSWWDVILSARRAELLARCGRR